MTGPEAVEAAARRLGARARFAVPLGPLTTYRVGGPAAVLVEADTEEDLIAVAGAVADSGLAVLVVGRGSNLLVADGGFGGIAVVLGAAFDRVDIEGATVRAGGATSLPVAARRTARAGLTGFEWAVGVPGSVGGAVRMNAGGHGSDMAASLESIRVADLTAGEDGAVPASCAARDLALGYRRSSIEPRQVVVEATLALAPGDVATAEAEIAEIVRWRRHHQPGGPNAGSVFTNPDGRSAGQLIDAAGAKGLRVGSAAVSDKHANFIQADPGGRAADIIELMAQLVARVADATGVTLRPETRLVGFDRLPEALR